MRNHTSVRKPSLTHSNIRKGSDAELSVGDILRREKKNLLLMRILLIMFIILVITAIVTAGVLGYLDGLIDKIYDLMG